MIRIAIALIALLAITDNGTAQLLDPSGLPPSWRMKIERTSKVPPKLSGQATLRFLDLDICFDGGSHGARFRRHDGGSLFLFFPHPGYWSEKAKTQSIQPVAVQVKRGENDVLVEIDQNSALEKRIVELLTLDLRNGNHDPDDTKTLTRIRDCVRDRRPLKEIEKLIDPDTGELKLEEDPVELGNPFQ
jgi:hypothetical protein